MASKKLIEISDQLEELFEKEHGGCDNNTCAMTICMSHGYSLWAIYLFSGTGAASDEFSELYEKLPKKEFAALAEAERAEFVEQVPSVACPHCNAVVYEPENSDYHCSSCAKEALFQIKGEVSLPDGVSCHTRDFDGWVEDFKVIRAKQASETETVFSIAMKYGKEPEELTLQIFEASVGAELPSRTVLKHSNGQKVA